MAEVWSVEISSVNSDTFTCIVCDMLNNLDHTQIVPLPYMLYNLTGSDPTQLHVLLLMFSVKLLQERETCLKVYVLLL